MFDRLFKKFTTSEPKPQVLKSSLDEQRQVQHRIAAPPVTVTAVDVPPAQSCVLIQQDGESATLHSGTHELQPGTLDPAKALHYLYLRDSALCEGEWAFDYTDHHQAALSLSGHYSVSVSSAQRLAQSCLKAEHFADERDFSPWMSQSIAAILKTQRVPAADIRAENLRFTNYLRDALALALRPKGLALQALSLSITKPELSAQTTPSHAEQPHTPRAEDAPKDRQSVPETTQEQDADTVEQVIVHRATQPEKLFYYVRNGQQHGPFSRNDIEEKLADSTLHKRDLLWQKGLTTWKPIADFDEFNDL